MLSLPMTFRPYKTDEETQWTAINLREATITSYELMARTCLGRIFEIITFAERPGFVGIKFCCD